MKTSWLSSWMIHNANNIRNSLDGLKVGAQHLQHHYFYYDGFVFLCFKKEDRLQ